MNIFHFHHHFFNSAISSSLQSTDSGSEIDEINTNETREVAEEQTQTPKGQSKKKIPYFLSYGWDSDGANLSCFSRDSYFFGQNFQLR